MMSDSKIIDWPEIMNKFAAHKGTIVDFCNENNIKPYQLYHRRAKLMKKQKPNQIFHAIDVHNNSSLINPKDALQTIKIEIGNARIYIPAADNDSLLNIIRELAKSC
jgi:hypothetical protein